MQKPFAVQNLGKYERQLWQVAEFGEKAEARTAAYRHFILDLYKATPLDGYLWIHGYGYGYGYGPAAGAAMTFPLCAIPCCTPML